MPRYLTHLVAVVFIITYTTGSLAAGSWWNSNWNYRVPLTVNSGDYQRSDRPVEVAIDFTSQLTPADSSTNFDVNSIRVHEVDVDGKILLPENIPFQFDLAASFNALNNAQGTLVFLLEGTTPVQANRYFHVYFDVEGGGYTLPAFINQITVTDSTDEAQDSFLIDTLTADYHYQKQAGGFSSIIDIDGNDWINYNSATGSAGAFRGIPNLVFDNTNVPTVSHFHPGTTTSNSILVHQGPLKATIKSTTNDDLWEVQWEFFPKFARMSVLLADANYWFLYEGTPGGLLDINDNVTRPDGTKTSVLSPWDGDLVNQEWVYFSDSQVGESLFLVHHEDDMLEDSYRDLDDLMTVFGFGRLANASLLESQSNTFTIGLTDTTDFTNTSTTIDSAYKDISVSISPADLFDNAINDAPVAVADSYQTLPDTPLLIDAATGVLDNDTDADLDILQALLVSDVSSGSLTLNSDGSFDYTPNTGFSGSDSFTYQANDGIDNSNEVTVTILVSTSNPEAVVILPLDEGSGTLANDLSGLGNDGLLLNGALFEASTGDDSASSVRFDGINDHIDLGTIDVAGNGLTLATWFNADSYPGSARDPRLISKASGTAANNHVFMLSTIRSGLETRLRARVRIGGSTATLIANSGNLGTGVWHHAAATYDGVTLRLYLDGIEVGSTPLSGAMDVDATLPVTVGSQPPGAGGRFFDGLLDDVRILQRALSVSEIITIVDTNVINDAPVAVADSYQTFPDTPLLIDAATGVLDNDTDADLDILQALLVNDVSSGSLTLNSDGSFDYTPNTGFSGSDSFTYQANDGIDNSNEVTVTILVSTSNPEAVVILPLDEGSGTLANDLSGLGNDGLLLNGALFEASTGDDSASSVRFDGINDHIDLGTIDVAGNGLTLATWFNADSYPGSARDPRLISKASGTAANNHVFMLSTIRSGLETRLRARVRIGGSTATLIANSGNLGTGVWHHAAATYDGVTLRLYLDGIEVGSTPLSGAMDVDATLPVTVGSQPPGAGGRFFDGLLDDVRILQRALSVSEIITIVDTNVINDAPVAVADSYQTFPDTPLLIDAATGVLDNDTDADLDILQALLVNDVSSGSLTLNSDGSFDYTPNTGFSGSDSFTYQANDGIDNSNEVTVTILVSTSNPEAVVILPLDEGSGTLANDLSGLGNDGLLLNGALFEASTGDDSASSVRFDGINDHIDLGTIDVAGNGLTLATWFNADSYPGSARDPRLISKASGTAANNHVFMLSTIRSGLETRLRARVRIGGSTATLIANSGNLGTGVWHHAAATYDGVTLRLYLDGIEVGSTPLSGAMDVDATLPVTVGSQPPGAGGRFFDGLLDDVRILQRALSVSEIIAIVDTNVINDAPVAVADSYQTLPDTALLIDAATGVLNNDTDADLDVLQALLVSDVSSGSLTLNSDGSFDYTPNTGSSGSDSFTYQANDGIDNSNEVTVTLNVDVINDAPVAVADSYQTFPDTPLLIDAATGVLDNDTDTDLDILQALLVNDVSSGSLTLNSDGSFDYTPNTGFSGSDSFTYKANDGIDNSNEVTVTIDVNAINNTPVAVADSYQTLPDTPLMIDAATGVLDNDTDADLDVLQAVLVSDVSSGSLTLNSDGSFDYTPNTVFSGSDSFTYQANDGVDNSNIATVTISVSSVNSPPQIVSGQIVFTKQIIDNQVNEVHFVVAADFNGDDLIDIVATDFVDDSVFWYENNGNGGFVTRVLDTNLNGAYPAHVDDVDLDGDIDILAAGYNADTFVWYENDGNGGFTRRDIDTTSDGAHSIVTVDMDQDGDVDLLTSSQDAGTIAWYENDGISNFTRHIIDNTATAAKRADFGDMDGDGDIDVITASFAIDEISWLENDGNEEFTKRIIVTSADGAYFVSPADVDADGDIDIMTASQHDNTFAWYENNGTGGFTEHIIDSRAAAARTIIGADIDSDGDVDALGASRNNDTIAWYSNDGNGVFTKQVIDLAADGAYGIFAIDMDRDGDMDVLSGSRNSFEVALHTQIRSHLATVVEGGTIVINETTLLTIDADNGPLDLIYTVTDAPLAGQLKLEGSPLLSGETFTQDDINNDRVTYVHNGTNSVTDEFTFTVEDINGSGAQPLTSNFTINVTG